MLNAYRVLDLCDERGLFCSYLLASLGADVVAIEPPGGSSTRRCAPVDDQTGQGLWWQAYGRGKRSITLDLQSPDGRARLAQLAADADFLIDSHGPTEAKRLGLSPDGVRAMNPALIHVTITPFGANGPKADWPATDLTAWAASGAHSLAGDEDRAPVRTSVPQTFLHAGADAAGAALIALQQRHRSGLGQHVDVSAQQSCAQAALAANLATPNNGGFIVQRMAGGLRGVVPVRLTWPCADGHVALTLLFGPAFTAPNRRLLQWLLDHGACTQAEADLDWGLEMTAVVQGDKSPDAYFTLCAKIEDFFSTRTQTELFDDGLARGCYIAPTLDVAGLLDERQFSERDFWRETQACDRVVRVPGPFAKFSATPLPTLGPAPVAGSTPVARAWSAPRDATVPPNDTRLVDARPLDGLKVLDFMWVIAGPFFTRVLNDFGATVIKVESTRHLEPARGATPHKDGQPTLESGVPFANFNAGKLGITVDPTTVAGRDVILDLVRWADVVTESFSPKAMRGWGLDYDSLKRVNPSVIMVSSCLMGQTGPRAQVPGYGNMAAALTGFYDLTGWRDRSPAGPYLAYTDGVAPRFMLAGLLAALEHRRHTGEGQHIDLSQAEAAIHLLAPALLDYQTNGRVWHRMGNRDLALCPNGVYPTLGEDRWIAISCQHDEAWQALVQLAGWRVEPDLASAGARRRREDELDDRLATWTSTHDGNGLQQQLINAGVAAHVVQNSPECVADPQLIHRNHFVDVAHPSLGSFVVENTRFQLSRTPGHVARAAPELGEHNYHVLKDVLGYDDDRIADIFAALAME